MTFRAAHAKMNLKMPKTTKRTTAKKTATKKTKRIYQDTLPNGLVVITEPMEHVHSVSTGIWVRSGSRREPADLNGVSHFIEHMVFKGTRRRSAEDIAREVDSVGGMLDAFTAKEMVCFNTKVLGEHLPRAFDIVADMVLEPKIPKTSSTSCSARISGRRTRWDVRSSAHPRPSPRSTKSASRNGFAPATRPTIS
jgi:secreted Zn-dependent insulinase-like peptidase